MGLEGRGKVILITGAGSEMGQLAAQRFCTAGAGARSSASAARSSPSSARSIAS